METRYSYKAKFDIGPTGSSGAYFSMPNPDGCIQFEDLAIFSLGYGKTANAAIIENHRGNRFFFVCSRFHKKQEGCMFFSLISGDHMKCFAHSQSLLRIRYCCARIQWILQKSGEMNFDYCFMAAKALSKPVTLDGAVMSLHYYGISKQGIIAYVILNSGLY